MGNYTISQMFENPRRGRQARNFTKNVSTILDLKSSSEQIFSRKMSLGSPDDCPVFVFPRRIANNYVYSNQRVREQFCKSYIDHLVFFAFQFKEVIILDSAPYQNIYNVSIIINITHYFTFILHQHDVRTVLASLKKIEVTLQHFRAILYDIVLYFQNLFLTLFPLQNKLKYTSALIILD